MTGGTGFIGAHLINALISDGKHVHALVRTPAKAEPLPKRGLTIFKGDILDPQSIKEAMEGCEEVYHLGGNASIYEKDPTRYFTINVDGTKNVMDVAIELGIRRMVFTSTAGVLGPSVGGVVTEEKRREIGFFNEYESSKAEAEELVRKYVEDKEIDVIIVSPKQSEISVTGEIMARLAVIFVKEPIISLSSATLQFSVFCLPIELMQFK